MVKREAGRGNQVAVVVSAMAGETDRLVQLCREAASLYDPREYDVVVASGEQVTSGLLAITLRVTTLTKGDAIATIVNDDSSTWVSGTMADFVSGTVGTGAYVADMSDGAVILQPRMANEFSGPTLPVGWTKNPNGTVTFTGGAAIVDGTQIQNVGGLFTNHTLEFAATFNGASRYMGTAQLRFNTKLDGSFFATTLAPKNQTVETPLPSSLMGAMHRFRIDWIPGLRGLLNRRQR